MNQPSTTLGDRSTMTQLLLVGCNPSQLQSLESSFPQSPNLRSEIAGRHDALKDVCRANSDTSADGVRTFLQQAQQALQESLYHNADLPTPNSAAFDLTQGSDVFPSPQIQGFVRWLQTAPKTPATQIVADLFLYWQLNSRHREVAAGLVAKLRDRFGPRVDAQSRFARWIPKNPTQWNTPDHPPVEHAPVCVPILLQESRIDNNAPIGVIRWLTVELFRDGFTGLIPDLPTLGMTCVNQPSPDSENPAITTSFLQHMDRTWHHSGLGEKGYSGRFRLLSRAPLHCSWLYPAEQQDDAAIPAVSFSGNSAQAALMIALLAASGHVFESIGSLPAWNGSDFTPPRPVWLNLDYAITAALQLSHRIDDPRCIPLDKVGGLQEKLPAVNRYSPLDAHENTRQRLFAMLLQSAEYNTESQKQSNSIVAESVRREQDAENTARRNTAADGNRPRQFHGVRFRSVENVQDALNLMLESNQWRHLMMQKKQQAWLADWSYPRNKFGQFLDKFGNVICDEQQQPITREDHELLATQSINSGSLEYMNLLNSSTTAPDILKRIAGATETPEEQPENLV